MVGDVQNVTHAGNGRANRVFDSVFQGHIRLPTTLTTATHLDKHLVFLDINKSDDAAMFCDRRINLGVQNLLCLTDTPHNSVKL